MATSLADFVALVQQRVADSKAKLTTVMYQAFILEALREYSRLRARKRSQDIIGTGAFRYDLAADFIDQFSVIESVEIDLAVVAGVPVENQVPVWLSAESFMLYKLTNGTLQIRLLDRAPVATDAIRVNYTTTHTATDGPPAASTVPVTDDEAVANLAASIAHRKLASEYSETTDSTFTADIVNYRSKAAEHTALADKLHGLWLAHMQLGRDGQATVDSKFASATIDLDVSTQFGRDRLTHSNRWR